MTYYMDCLAVLGERVVMKMDKEAKHQGRKGPKDGTLGTIVGRHRITLYKAGFGLDMHFHKPGVYETFGSIKVKFDGYDEILCGNGDIEALDKEAYEERYQKLWAIPVIKENSISATEQEYKLDCTIRISNLPETKFYEGDIVRYTQGVFSEQKNNILRVNSIQYTWVHGKKGDDRGMCYCVEWIDPETYEYARQGSSYGHDSDLELIERGNVWKHYHNKPLFFRDIREEVAFAEGMGKIKEVRNPANNLYFWTKEEALQAVKDGIADCMTVNKMFFSLDNRISMQKCEDQFLGERLRAEFIKGWNI